MKRKTASLRQPRLRQVWMAAAFVVLGLFASVAVAPALAQSIGSSFQAYQTSTDEPIDIEADLLEVDDKQKQAVFKGNVVARQGGFSLKAKELAVHYTGQPSGDVATASTGGRNASIRRIEAKGKVLVTTKDDQTATSEWANFDVEEQVVTIGGNVVLSQGENVLRGDRLVIDLKSGKSRFEVKNESGKQRIRGLFQPRQD
ncbi:lipopolysaccharide transport periplasmic protein LptA [Dichotomicrobium thermohalophilum]|uniref:Lipopolysaccharide export system protein LptA n=1 Tax=Dichotomicrobium thermohalophilum TaxID=933063 RepID=A0A397QA25_9HYPH|nr:lipopolysaccharide transport periplasmic protein LptA [Dichotomicrobium thermohalophilum]RIA56645.1 lipopolysaccharide export system protein LptA [Dichotomicrobium thermohalophilum]